MSKRNDIHKVLIIGSGPIIIGQACEFDYSPSKLFLIHGQEFCWFSAFSFYCICCPVVQYILN